MRRAFTLIELLVVITIIAILIAILLAGIAGVRRAGRDSVCRANLNQIATSIQVYVSDHRTFPRSLRGPEEEGSLGLPRESFCCPLYPREHATEIAVNVGINAGWTYQQLNSYESVPCTPGENDQGNPRARVIRWEQQRPDKQEPLVNDMRVQPPAIGWHGEKKYLAYRHGAVVVWNGELE